MSRIITRRRLSALFGLALALRFVAAAPATAADRGTSTAGYLVSVAAGLGFAVLAGVGAVTSFRWARDKAGR